MSDVTRILSQIDAGDPQAAGQLLPLVYDELRKLAAARLAHEKPGQTLQATALVHEAYLRLVGGQESGARSQESGVRSQESGASEESCESNLTPGSCPPSPVSFDSRGHFFAAAAEAMRRILVENARRRASLKRGENPQRVDLDSSLAIVADDAGQIDLLALDEALAALETHDAAKARLVKLRFFAGLSIDQAASALGISTATAKRHWIYARAWLFGRMGGP
jgi:DNA-directed RNA polymerase specialized sigma24 family protein